MTLACRAPSIVFGLSVLFCAHSNLVIYHSIASKFHIIWITYIKLSPKFEYDFCPMNENQMVVKMSTTCLLALVDTLSCVIYHPISSKFHILIAFIKRLPAFEYWFCLMNDNQDYCQWLSPVDLLLWTLLVFYHPISNFIHALLKSISHPNSNSSMGFV